MHGFRNACMHEMYGCQPAICALAVANMARTVKMLAAAVRTAAAVERMQDLLIPTDHSPAAKSIECTLNQT